MNAPAAKERQHLRDYLIAGMNPFADGTEPAAMAETILSEVFGLANLLGLAFDDAAKSQEHHPLMSSEVMQGTPLQHARAMEAIARLVALAGFYVSAAVRGEG